MPSTTLVERAVGVVEALAALLTAVLLLPALGCDGTTPARGTNDAGRSAAVARSAALAPRPPLDLRFERARGGDAIALGQLGDELGARGLWPWVRFGGVDAKLALAALAHADDAELVIGQLAELALSDRPVAERRLLLRTIVELAGRRPEPVERLDPDSLRRCIEQLQALSRDAGQPRELRVLAVSALRTMAHADYLPPEGITEQLDP